MLIDLIIVLANGPDLYQTCLAKVNARTYIIYSCMQNRVGNINIVRMHVFFHFFFFFWEICILPLELQCKLQTSGDLFGHNRSVIAVASHQIDRAKFLKDLPTKIKFKHKFLSFYLWLARQAFINQHKTLQGQHVCSLGETPMFLLNEAS